MKNPEKKNNILLVDDRAENLLALEALLESPDIDIYKAFSGNEALGLMLEHDFALVLLDVQMPEMDGFEVAELMRKSEKTKHLPIIFVSALSKNDSYVFKGYESGAVDYLFKPLDPVVLKSKVNTFLELDKHKQALVKSHDQIQKSRDEIQRSRDELKRANLRLKDLSHKDGLTGLYNHRHFHELLIREFFQARRNRYDIACFMIDLDYFKDVNDTFGHIFGDFVLKNFAKLICRMTRKTDLLGRYGGEEFIVLLPHTDLEGARILAEKFRQKAELFVYKEGGHSKRVTTSIGISTYDAHHPSDPNQLVTFADKALYLAKSEGRNRVKIYNEKLLTQNKTLKLTPMESGTLMDLQDQLGKVLAKARDFVMASLGNLIAQLPEDPQTSKNLQYTLEHNTRVQEILELMSIRLGLPRSVLHTFKRAAKLHDLFRIYLNDETPMKDGPLNEEEQLDIKDYPFMLEQLAQKFEIFKDEKTVLLYHHEHYDGSGYPEGLKGDDVPLGARLFSLVDAFVSMSSKRSYKPVLSPNEVLAELERQSGKQFDPILVKHLVALIKKNRLLLDEDKDLDVVQEVRE